MAAPERDHRLQDASWVVIIRLNGAEGYILIWKIRDSARIISEHDVPFFPLAATSGQPDWYTLQMRRPGQAGSKEMYILLWPPGFSYCTDTVLDYKDDDHLAIHSAQQEAACVSMGCHGSLCFLKMPFLLQQKFWVWVGILR